MCYNYHDIVLSKRGDDMIIALVNDNVRNELEKLVDKEVIYCKNEHMVRVKLTEHRNTTKILVSPSLIEPSLIRVLNTQVKKMGPKIKEIEVIIDNESSDVVKELIKNSIMTIIYRETVCERLSKVCI